jgi:hypothetical protein
MTFEKKCLVEFSDIGALHLECPRCGTVSAFQRGDWLRLLPESLSKGCSYCGASFDFKGNTAEYDAICNMVASLAKIADVLRGKNLNLKLEITCPE